MRYDELPAKLRAQVDAQLGGRSRVRARPSSGSDGGACRYRCHVCREEFPSWTKAQKHARDEQHGRQDMLLDDPPS